MSFTVNGGASTSGVIDPGGTTATLIEPHLGVNKTVTFAGGGTSGDAGDTVNYSAVISHLANSLAGAFDTTFTDTLPTDFNTPGSFTVTDSVLGNISSKFQIVGGVLQTIPGQTFDLALNEKVTIAFSTTLKKSVTPNETIDSTASIAYSGLPGDKTATGGYNPSTDVTTDRERAYAANDNGPVTVPVATMAKSLFTTSDTNTAGSNVAIGETVTYALKVTLPEGTTPNLSAVDNLPVGMQYVSSQIVTTAAASGGLLAADYNGTLPAPTISGGTGDGVPISFAFGSIATASDNVANNNSFVILVTARVLNDAGNVGTTPGQTSLANTATLTVPSDPTVTTPPVNVTGVEPKLVIAKSVNDTTPDIGETLNYTLTVSHTAASMGIAYDVIVRDAMPAGMTLDLTSIRVNGVLIASSPLVDAGSNNSTTGLIDFRLTSLAVGSTVTITYNATVSQALALAGTNLDNNARIYWDSQPTNNDNNAVLTGIPNGTTGRDSGATPGYTEAPTPAPNDPAQDTQRVTVSASTITGTVYQDVNANGVFDAGDVGINNVIVALTGTDLNGNAVSLTTLTSGGGAYSFTGLPAGVYTITETQPAAYTDGVETVGTNFGGTKSNALGSDTISTLTIASHTSLTGAGYNFGEVLPSSIVGSVYSDVNNNGTRDGGEIGIQSVPVQLTGTDVYGQSVSLSGSTDSNGNYVFNNGGVGLRPGTYVVTEVTQPAAYLDGKDTAGTSGGNATTVNDQISAITIPQNTAATAYNFGELNPASLTGFVYYDPNNDGAKEAGEPGIQNVTVTLTGTDDLGNAFNVSTTTDSNGAYTFANLRPSNGAGYTITETQPAAYLDGKDTLGTGLTSPNSAGTVGADKFTGVAIVNVAPGNNAGANYNFGEVLAGSVSGRVFSDNNDDGTQNGADAGISGVTVKLTGSDDLGNVVSLTTTTNGTGDYTFTGLRPSGSAGYTITETQPAGYLDGKDTAGSTGGNVALPPSDTISAVPIVSNANSTGNNFAELNPANLSGTVYVDSNNDGIQEAGENGISGVTVTLTGTNDLGQAVSVVTTTNGAGSYNFANVRPGNYTITETQPAAYLDGKDALGTGLTGANNPGTLGNDVVTGIAIVDVTPGNNSGTGYNFGELVPASLAGFVYSDANNDGVKQGGEAGIGGVTVTLTGKDDLGNSVSVTTTTANLTGAYSFTNLRPSDVAGYTITETQPAAFLDGKDTIGTPGGTTANDQFSGISVVSGTTGVNNNFGELTPASLSGFVYSDANNDGVKQAGESGIGGTFVTLTGTDDLGNVVNVTTTTANLTGAYSFTNLRPSDAAGYTITETQPAAFLDGKDTIGTPGGTVANDQFSGLSIVAGTAGVNNNFGELAPSTLSGRVFNDGNNDGIQNGTDAAIPGVTVVLTGTDDLGNSVSTTTTTNGTGDYSFANLRPGNYVITETQPSGLLDGKNVVGTQGGNTVNNPLSDTITAINLATSGITGTGNNFAELNPASLSGYVYQDLNNNGVREPGESGIQGVTVTLTGTDDLGNTVNTVATTGTNGAYNFTNLRPGIYQISETQPTGYTSGINAVGNGLSAPNAAGTVSGDNIQAITFANVAAGNNTGIEYDFGEIFAAQLSKSVVSTSEAFTTGSAVAVGETVRYSIVAEIPQSTLTDLVVSDLLPSGLTFLNNGNVRYAFVAANVGAITSTATPDAPAVLTGGPAFFTGDQTTVSSVTPSVQLGAANVSSDIANTAQTFASGGAVYFHLGTVQNSDGTAGSEFVVIQFDALVNNQTSNQAGTTLGNGAQVIFDKNNDGVTTAADTPTVTLAPAAGPQVTVAEANLTISKTTPALPNPVDAGDTISYTITVTNNAAAVFGAANAADAFNVGVQDILDAIRVGNPTVELTLANPATDVSVVAPGYATVTNNSTNAAVNLTLSQLKVGDSATITVNALVKTNAAAGSTISNTATASYTSLPNATDTPGAAGSVTGERTGGDVPAPTDNSAPSNSTILNNYAVAASSVNKTVATPTITKTLVSTSEAATTGNNVAVGETVTYALNITLPEGVTQSASVVDSLPAGLQFVSATANFAGSGVTPFILPAPTTTGGVTTGTNVTWTLGNLTNAADNNPANNTFQILVTALVADIPGNSAGTTRTNDASLAYNDGTSGMRTVATVPASDPTVTVVEPKLVITKAVDDTTPDINQTLHYTLTLTNPAVANAADAFNIFVRDAIPSGVTLDPSSILINGVSILTSPLVEDGTGNSTGSLLNLKLTTLGVGQTITITYAATVNNTLANVGTTQDNNARIYWDSLAANEGQNSVLSGTPNTGSNERDYGATPGYTEAPTPGVDDPAQDTQRIVVNTNAITGTAYDDNNANGVFDAGDTAIGGVTLTLTGTSASGLPVNVTTTTANDGSYSFGNLPPGTYLITETQPAGYVDGLETAGTPTTTFGGTKSDALNSNTISAIAIPAQSNATEGSYNFGETLPSSLAGSVYLDTDNNGIRSAGEVGIPNVPITLTGTDVYGQPITLTGTTNGNGDYTFTGLRPSNGAGYTVTENDSAIVPVPYLDGKDTPGSLNGVLGGTAPKYDVIQSIVVAQNQNGTAYNFGELVPASISGIVYNDLNNNGSVDPGENGIPNASVVLTGTDDLGASVNVSLTTQPDGTFSFGNLRPGTYTVTETTPAGFLDGKDTVGTLGGVTGVNDVFSGITVNAGDGGTNYRFGELTPSSLSAVVFSDLNNNGTQDAGEAGIGGVPVTLTGTDDLNNAVSIPLTTLGDGTVTFTNLRPGTYTISETQPPAYLDGKDGTGTLGGSNAVNDVISGIVVAPAQNGTGNRFGELLPSSLSGRVFIDTNNNGVLDGGETTLDGVTVTLTGKDDLGNSVNLTATTVGGIYTFNGLRPSDTSGYTVTETQPPGLLDGKNAVGTSGGVTVNNPLSDVISSVVIQNADTHANGYDFGELQPAMLSGVVFQDFNLDGIENGPDSGLSGVTVTLNGTDDLGNSVTLTQPTTATGTFSFGGLRPGTYAITETQPAGYDEGIDTVGTAGGSNAVIDRFGGITLGSGTNGTGYTFAEIFQFDPTKSIVSTSNPGTSGNNLSIGEVARYRIVVSLPDGTLPSLVLEDLMPAGLVFLNDGTAAVSLVSQSGNAVTSTAFAGPGLASTSTSSAPTFLLPGSAVSSSLVADVDTYGNGTDVYFKLGDVKNTEVNVLGGEYAVIDFNARVANIPANRLGSPLDNTVRVLFDLDNNGTPDVPPVPIVSAPVKAAVAEPVLYIDKELTGGSATPKENDILTFTVTIGHATGSDATAWETAFSDSLPKGLDLQGISTSASGGAVITRAAAQDANGNLGGQFDIPVGGKITITYTVKVNVKPALGVSLVNAADVTWTSLPGDSQFERHSGDSLYGGGGLHDYEARDRVIITPSLFAFDTFNNFSITGQAAALDMPGNGIDVYRGPLLPLAPIYSGEADPGSTLVLTLYNANGENIGTQSVVVDSGGNWMVSFPSSTIRDYPNSVQISQSGAFYSLSDPHGHNMRTYFSPALNAGHFFFEELQQLSEGSAAPLLGDIGTRMPIWLGSVKYSGELLSAIGAPGGY